MILGIIDHDRGNLNEQSSEMLTLAREITIESDEDLGAVIIGENGRALADGLAEYGVTTAYLVVHDGLNDYAPEAWAQSVIELIEDEEPEAVLAPGTERGNEILAHIAARLNQPMAANVTAVTPGDNYQITRMRWGGSLLEDALLKGEPKLLSIAPHVIAKQALSDPVDLKLEIVEPDLDENLFRVRVTKRVQPETDKISLAEARVVVGGGRGVGSKDGFAVLEELADLVKGAIGGSRVVTNLGWRPHADQIGQTGTRIAPDLYIACGISGAIQHWVGCKGAKRILAINIDPEAPLVSKADYAIIGDLHVVVPAICTEIRRLQSK